MVLLAMKYRRFKRASLGLWLTAAVGLSGPLPAQQPGYYYPGYPYQGQPPAYGGQPGWPQQPQWQAPAAQPQRPAAPPPTQGWTQPPPRWGAPQTSPPAAAPAQPSPQPAPRTAPAPGWGQGQPPAPYGSRPQQPLGQWPGAARAPAVPTDPATIPQQPAAPPSAPGYPAGAPSAYTAPSPRYSAPPSQPPQGVSNGVRLEAYLANSNPYLQQSVVLALRLSSNGALATATPQLPRSHEVIFKRLGDPVSSTGARQEIVTQYYYAVTPLREGLLILPPIGMTGSYAGGGQTFEVSSPTPLVLDVRPADLDVTPWLPLHGLTLQAYIEGDEKPEAGKPMRLVVDLNAVGATGAQLPSLESQLRGDGFRLYRERSNLEGKVSGDARYLLGRRTDTFTLVPQHGGKVQIPALEVRWWNVDTGRVETAAAPIRQLVAAGQPGAEDDRVGELFPGATSLLLWVPLGLAFAFSIGFWILAWLRHKRFGQVVEEELVMSWRFIAQQIHHFLEWLSPIRRLQRLRQIFVRSLPKSYRLYFCVKVVENENDPEVWSYMLRFLANKHLGLPTHDSMAVLGERILRFHPGADAAEMRRLMQQLDANLYFNEPIEFAAWKRDFRRQLRPTLFGHRDKREADRPHGGLPSLNPEPGS